MNSNDQDVVDLCEIGPGYRNVVYQSSKGGGRIILYGYDKHNNPKTFTIPHISKAKYEVKFEAPDTSIFNKPVATKCFDTSYERYKWLQSLSDSVRVLEAHRPEVEFLHDQFSDIYLNPDFNTQPLRTHYLDIEIAIASKYEPSYNIEIQKDGVKSNMRLDDFISLDLTEQNKYDVHDEETGQWSTFNKSSYYGDEFPHAIDAAYPINLITIYDSKYKRYYTWVLGDVKNTFTKSDKDVILFKFDKEADLLHNFIKWYRANYPDVITGWNIRYFDVPYIIRRLENVLGNKAASYISPVRKYRDREGFDAKGRETYCHMIDGVTQLDMLPLYRDKFMFALALDGGYNLDNVAEHELGEHKLKYDGTFKDFYTRDFQKFFEYNVRDVELTVKLEEKLQMISLARKIAADGLCQYETIYYSLPYLIGSLSLFAKTKMDGKVFPSYAQHENEREDFEGAYVFPAQKGFYQHGIACIDLNSLYPNTIISINCSPETKVGQVTNNDEDDTFTVRSPNGLRKTFTREQFDHILAKKCILTKNNTLFLKHEHQEGLIPMWSEYFYNARKVDQKIMKDATRKLAEQADILTEDEKVELSEKVNLYYAAQLAKKNALNSVYGLLGTPYSPIYDIDLAQSITLNGQFTNKSVAKFVQDEFKVRYDYEEGKDGAIIVAGDTDSCDYSTLIDVIFNSCMNNVTQFKIGELWDKLAIDHCVTKYKDDYDIIECNDIQIRTINNQFKPLLKLSRHYTTKKRVRIHRDHGYVDVTTDHVCMILTRDMMIENLPAKDLIEGMSILVYDRDSDSEKIKSITKIEVLEEFDGYVYDCEVDDPDHSFYANDILIHNSCFLNIEPLTLKYAKKFNIEPNLLNFTSDQFKALSNELDTFVNVDINNYTENLINDACHTTRGHHVRYGREYIASEGMFFKKKHYLVHIIDDEGTAVNKFKYSGIAVKKTLLPTEMKPLLKHIYEHTCIDKWVFADYQSYLNQVFESFRCYNISDIALNQSYNTEKQIVGFLKSEKGTQAAVRAAHYYNQILTELKIDNQYDQILLGDRIRYAYVYKNNQYGIDVIGYKTEYPKEFEDIFEIDYERMFQKLFIDSLKGYVDAMGFNEYQPSNQMETDVFTL